MKLKPLGILYLDDKVVNHRSLLKIICNPFLRLFGFCFATVFEGYNIKGIKLIKQDKSPNLIKNIYSSLFTCNHYNKIKFKRVIL